MGGSVRLVDLAHDRQRQVVVDAVPGQYLGQPDTVLLEDGHTVLVAYPLGHGGPDTALKRSRDGGRTWGERLPVPDNFAGTHNAPTIHRLVDPSGVRRLVLVVSYPRMVQSVSADDGVTWTPLQPMFADSFCGSPGHKGHAPPKSVVPIAGDRYLSLYHDHFDEGGQQVVAPMEIITCDGGLTWSLPKRVGHHPKYPGAQPCEPALISSPDGQQLLCLLRENSRTYCSLWMTSDDNGETWSKMEELSPTLTGDRHVGRYAPDGRLVITFRDMAPGSETRGDFVAWIGTYDDIVGGGEGDCRVRLLRNRGRPGDTGYAGMEVLPDGTFICTTYCVLDQGEQPVVVSVRFRPDEVCAHGWVPIRPVPPLRGGMTGGDEI